MYETFARKNGSAAFLDPCAGRLATAGLEALFKPCLLALAAMLAGCASPVAGLSPGLPQAEVLARMGPATASYDMAGGGRRLEFANGPHGRTTWMVDVGADGRLQRFEQVLDERHFARVEDGMSRDDLLRLLGRPAQVSGKWRGGQIWSWRFETNDCFWVQVEMDAQGRVQGGAAQMPDPRCDAPNDKS